MKKSCLPGQGIAAHTQALCLSQQRMIFENLYYRDPTRALHVKKSHEIDQKLPELEKISISSMSKNVNA